MIAGQRATLMEMAAMDSEPINNTDDIDYKAKYEALKEFVRGKWKSDCTECASIANEILNKENRNE